MLSFSISIIFLQYISHFYNISTSAITSTVGINIQFSSISGTIKYSNYTFWVSQGDFGVNPPIYLSNNSPMIPVLPPDDDRLLCNEASGINDYSSESNIKYFCDKKNITVKRKSTIWLVPRGNCTFERKALSAQRLGANAIAIYGTLASRYSLNSITDDAILWPMEYDDYDCSMERSYILKDLLSFDPLPYNSNVNDPLLSGTSLEGNKCAFNIDGVPKREFEEKCPSLRCLLTGKSYDNLRSNRLGKNLTLMEACCAWDKHKFLYHDPMMESFRYKQKNTNQIGLEEITIPVIYMSMKQAKKLFQDIEILPNESVTLTLFGRYVPYYRKLSSYLCWIMGLCVTTISAYMSAGEYRKINRSIYFSNYWRPLTTENENSLVKTHTFVKKQHLEHEENFELTMRHAFGFIICSLTGLLALFYLKIYSVAKIVYAFGCSTGLFRVLILPFFQYLVSISTLFCGRNFIKYISILIAYGLGFYWLYISLTIPHPASFTFFWIIQDVMGTCVCISFLSVVHLNGLKVATVLLTLALSYDIFMVFLTPMFTYGQRSIMVDVATSGGLPIAGPEWCEKYPDNKECLGGDPLPMVLTVPRFGDFQGGNSLLGLGDIVLPGLLLAFAARNDAAIKMIRRCYSTNNSIISNRGGYFIPLCILYGIGLAMADLAVYMTDQGQPALLYIVPCCLGGILIMAWTRKDLVHMWDRNIYIITAERLLKKETIIDASTMGTLDK